MKQTALGGPLGALILEDDFFKPGPKAKKSRPLSGPALDLTGVVVWSAGFDTRASEIHKGGKQALA